MKPTDFTICPLSRLGQFPLKYTLNKVLSSDEEVPCHQSQARAVRTSVQSCVHHPIVSSHYTLENHQWLLTWRPTLAPASQPAGSRHFPVHVSQSRSFIIFGNHRQWDTYLSLFSCLLPCELLTSVLTLKEISKLVCTHFSQRTGRSRIYGLGIIQRLCHWRDICCWRRIGKNIKHANLRDPMH